MPPLPPVLLVRDPRFREHAAPGAHPECPERLDAIDAALGALPDGVTEIAARAASDEELLRVHSRDYLAQLARIDGRRAQLDPDTHAAPGSVAAARLAAGSLIELVARVARAEARAGFAALRPPGHHAERERAMGFCLLNNAALAARALQAEGVERIAIVDWDVHHGNGTQHAFEAERDVLFASLHQFPFYPGTGALHERGSGAGLGATVNLPLPAGCGDAEYASAFESVLLPVLRAFRPEFVLVSAGFDAHAADPLASMRLSTGAYAWFCARLRELAQDCCGGRLVLALEGGYDLRALGDSVAASVSELAVPEPARISLRGPTAPGWEAVVGDLRGAHSGSWPVLQHRALHLGQ
jgi:acetoin utilization deacetylase AcuC-like enzyme